MLKCRRGERRGRAGLLGDPTGSAAPAPDTTGGAGDLAGSAAGQAQHLTDAHAAGDGAQNVSDQPQTLTTDSTDTASSET